MQLNHRKKVIAGATLGLLAFSSGLGIAFYSAQVEATSLEGGASVSADGPLNLVATLASGATDLVPGGAAKAVTVTISNPNPYQVGVDDSLALDVANLTSDLVGCSAGEALLTVAAPAVVNTVLAAGGTTTATFSVGMTSSPTVDQTACIGATFTIPLTVA